MAGVVKEMNEVVLNSIISMLSNLLSEITTRELKECFIQIYGIEYLTS